jgi:dCTP deaminase
VVLSDRTIKRLLDEGRIGIDPYDASLIQPSSVDMRVDRWFRVFRNSRYPYIDVKTEQEDLTELVEAAGGEPFILHPGEFVLGSTGSRRSAASACSFTPRRASSIPAGTGT